MSYVYHLHRSNLPQLSCSAKQPQGQQRRPVYPSMIYVVLYLDPRTQRSLHAWRSSSSCRKTSNVHERNLTNRKKVNPRRFDEVSVHCIVIVAYAFGRSLAPLKCICIKDFGRQIPSIQMVSTTRRLFSCLAAQSTCSSAPFWRVQLIPWLRESILSIIILP